MKAKIKATGKVVEVDDLYDDGTALVCGAYMKVSNLEFFDDIDWEQRRYEIAKEMMPVAYQEAINIILRGGSVEHNDIAKSAVKFADLLIVELKK